MCVCVCVCIYIYIYIVFYSLYFPFHETKDTSSSCVSFLVMKLTLHLLLIIRYAYKIFCHQKTFMYII